MPIRLREVLAARRRLEGLVRRTPLARSGWLSELTGGPVHLKLESLQQTGSFKLRGAFNAVLSLIERSPPGADLRLVTASAGNHGLAVAHVAAHLGLTATIFTPRTAPRAKLGPIRRYGADLRAEAGSYDEVEELARRYATQHHAAYIPPYNDPDVIAGAGTIALELLEDLPGLESVVVPLGGGGLLSGIASVTKAIGPETEVVGAETEASPAFHTSLERGRITSVSVGATIADGLAGNMEPDTITFAIIQTTVDRTVLVPESALRRAIHHLVDHEHVIAEGAGAAGVAALIEGLVATRNRATAVVVSGSNIDTEQLSAVLGGT